MSQLRKIAVIEDNPDNRLLVRVMLESQYEVIEYANGFAALEGLPRQKPDLVLLDICLPELDGGEVLQRIRADPALRDLRVIALTAHAMAGDREKYLAVGFNDYVAKPIVDEQVLLDAIRKQLAETLVAVQSETCGASCVEAALDRLRRLGGDQFVREMIGLFQDYVKTKLTDARQAGMIGNWPGVAKAVHPIKSSACNVGASRMQELANRLETIATEGPTAEIPLLLEQLEAEFAVATAALEAEKSKWEHTA